MGKRRCAVCVTSKPYSEFHSMERYGCTCTRQVVCAACVIKWFESNYTANHDFPQWSCPVCRGRLPPRPEAVPRSFEGVDTERIAANGRIAVQLFRAHQTSRPSHALWKALKFSFFIFITLISLFNMAFTIATYVPITSILHAANCTVTDGCTIRIQPTVRMTE